MEIHKEKEFVEFKKRWNKRCTEIKTSSLPKKSCYYISKNFLEESKELMIKAKQKGEVAHVFLEKVRGDLQIALDIALNNYKKEHNFFSYLSKIFHFKFNPEKVEVTLNKNEFK